MTVSFYNLDYIIEINQKRLEEYNVFLQKATDKYTNVILIYSGLGIFLVSLIQHLMDADINGLLYYLFFIVFAVCLMASLWYFVKLLLPAKIAYLRPPEKYYRDSRIEIEGDYPDNTEQVEESLKGAYIMELEDAILINYQAFSRKSSFYYNSLLFALLAVIPYIACIGFHLSKRVDKIQKIELVGKNL